MEGTLHWGVITVSVQDAHGIWGLDGADGMGFASSFPSIS